MQDKVSGTPIGKILGFVILGLFVSFIIFMERLPSTPETQVQSARESESPIAISADTLDRAYDQNEVSANAAYTGKMLLVTGTISSINQANFSHTIYLMLGQELGTQADLRDGQDEAASRLVKGGTVTVLCKNKGKLTVSPYLDDCVIQDGRRR